MAGRLQDKTICITGAARGLGAAIARRCAEEGAVVLLNDLSVDGVEAMGRELDARCYACDVSDSAAVDAMFQSIREDVGRLDVLINNAGISGSEGEDITERQQASLQRMDDIANGREISVHDDRTMELTDDEWRRMIATHVDGTFFCSRAALRLMVEQEGDRNIINMGSIMGTAGGGGASHYCAAKAAILGFTRSLAREVATRGIRVNSIAPGWIDTDMTAPFDLLRPVLAAQTPMLRFGEPDDIAWAAVYLASEEAKFVTGQVLSPNGGWHMSQ